MTTRTETATPDSSLEFVGGRRFGWAEALFGFFLTLAAAGVFAVAFLFGLGQAFAGRAMPGVTVGGVPIAGLDRTSAEARLREQLPSVSNGRLTLSFDGQETVVPYSDVRRDYDMDAIVNEALAVGRSGDAIEQGLERLSSLARGATVSTTVKFDDNAVRAIVEKAIAAVERPAVDAAVTYDAQASAWRVSSSADGRRVSAAAAQAAIADALTSNGAADAQVALSGERVEPAVTTAEAMAARDAAAKLTSAKVTLTADDTRFGVSQATMLNWLAFVTAADGTYGPSLDQARVQRTLKSLAPRVDRPSRNAAFQFNSGRATKVIAGKNGLKLDVAASAMKVTTALTGATAASPSIELATAISEPALTTQEAKALQPKLRRLGPGWTTHFPVGIKNFWGRNITIPAAKINGTILEPGELFDFWKRIEPVSYAAGYGRGGAIINGKTEKTGALAGGICSASTTMFNAAMRAGLEMGARRNHYYYISRYPVGLDATVFKGDTTYQTMTFRNDTKNPLIVRGMSGFGWVRFEVYGVPDGRRVSLSGASTWGHRSASDSVVYTRRLAPGVRERVEVPVDGFSASRTRTVYDRSGKVIHRDTWSSHYAVITGIVEVGAARAPITRPGNNSGGGTGDAPGTGGGG